MFTNQKRHITTLAQIKIRIQGSSQARQSAAAVLAKPFFLWRELLQPRAGCCDNEQPAGADETASLRKNGSRVGRSAKQIRHYHQIKITGPGTELAGVTDQEVHTFRTPCARPHNFAFFADASLHKNLKFIQLASSDGFSMPDKIFREIHTKNLIIHPRQLERCASHSASQVERPRAAADCNLTMPHRQLGHPLRKCQSAPWRLGPRAVILHTGKMKRQILFEQLPALIHLLGKRAHRQTLAAALASSQANFLRSKKSPHKTTPPHPQKIHT